MSFEELLDFISTEDNIDRLNSRRDELAEVIPELVEMFDFDQKSKYHQLDLWNHSLQVLSSIPRGINDKMLYLAALLHDIGKPSTQCKGKREDDPYMHYYGHAKAGTEIVENLIMPRIYARGDEISMFDHLRLIYYISNHDIDYKQFTNDKVRNLYGFVDNDCVKSLALLQIADADSHRKSDETEERIRLWRRFL